MKLWTYHTLAQALGLNIQDIKRDQRLGLINGQKVGGSYVFTNLEAEAYRDGAPSPGDRPKLYTVSMLAEELNCQAETVARIIGQGCKLDERQGNRGTRIYTEDEAATARRLITSRRYKKANVDEFIEERDGRYAILGTRNRHGQPFTSSTRSVARTLARKAHKAPPIYRTGQRVWLRYGGRTGKIEKVRIAEDVTPLDTSAVIRLSDGNTILVRLRELAGLVYETS